MTQTFAGRQGNQVGWKKCFKVEYWEMIKQDLIIIWGGDHLILPTNNLKLWKRQPESLFKDYAGVKSKYKTKYSKSWMYSHSGIKHWGKTSFKKKKLSE